jgi:hypothetical protein
VQALSNHHPAESRLVSAPPLFASPYFGNISQHEFPYQQSLDLESLIGCAQSVSYLPKDDDTIRQLGQWIEKHCAIAGQMSKADEQGRVCLVYHHPSFSSRQV